MDPLSDFCLRIVVCTIFLELLVAEKALLESACHTYVDWMEDLYGFEISEHVNVDPSNLSLPMCLQVMLHNNGGHLDLLQCGDIESNPGPELTKEDLAGLATAKDLHAVNVTLEKLLSSVSMVSQKVKSLETKITGVQSSMEKIKTTTDEHAATLKKLQDDFQETCAQNEDTKAECNKLKDKLDEIEDRSRRNNLLFAGIPQEDPAENWQQSEDLIKDTIRTKLNITEDIDIERAHRIPNGPKSSGAAPIIVKFNNFKDKQKILSASNKLKGSNIYINQDYCNATRMIHRALLAKKREIKSEVQRVDLKYRKLVVTDNDGNKSTIVYDQETKKCIP